MLTNITIMPGAWESIGQGTFIFCTEETAQYTQNSFYNSSEVDGDNVSYKTYLPAGTYTLMLHTRHSTNRGILDIYIDAAEVASFDLYNSPSLFNILDVQIGIVIATPGIKTIKLQVDGKNPSSTSYVFCISLLSLWATAVGAGGWTGKISGVTNPAKIMGVDVANIAKVKGVA